MKKKQLLKLTPPGITKEIKELAQKDTPNNSKGSCWDYTYKYGRHYSAKIEGKYLIVSIFLSHLIRSGSDQPIYILYIDKEADTFITYVPELRVWSNAMLVNLRWPHCDWFVKTNISQKDQETIRTYLSLSNNEEVQNYQYQARERQLVRRHKKLTDPWDEKMKDMPELPKDWEKWVAKTGIQQHFLFYNYVRGGAKEGYCSHCGKDVHIKSPKYNKRGICSHCKHPIQYKSIGKFGHILTEQYMVYLLQRKNSNVVIRKFTAYAEYWQDNYRTPKLIMKEEQRIFFDKALNSESYYYGLFKQREFRWIKGVYVASGFSYFSNNNDNSGKIYRRTLPSLDKCELKCTGLLRMVQISDVDPVKYLKRIKEVPVLEQVVKAGLYRFAEEIYMEKSNPLYLQAQKGGLAKTIGLDKHRLNRLRNLQGGDKLLVWLQTEKRLNLEFSDELILWFVQNRLSPDDFAFILGQMSFIQIKNYLIRQQMMSGEMVSEIVDTWEDYLSMANRLKMNVYDEIVYRPSNLYKRHEQAVSTIEKLELSFTADELLEKYPLVGQVIAGLQDKYGYQGDTYTILGPKSLKEILEEGLHLHHCIDKKEEYIERINNRESYILFLRKTKDLKKPFYTLEIEPSGVIRQKRTTFNRQDKDILNAEPFLRRWQTEIQKRLTEEDRVLADQSRHKRMEWYTDLRNRAVRINGGLYQGKLLADVLEDDLMEYSEAA